MKNKIAAIINNEYYRGGIILTLASIVGNFLNYLFNILVGRVLGPLGYGEMSAMFSYLVIFSVPVTVISTVLIQKIGSKVHNQTAYVQSLERWFYLKIKKLWIPIVLCFFLIPFVPRLTNLSPIVGYSLIPFIMVTLLLTFYDAAMQGMKLFMWFSGFTIFLTIIKLAGPLVALAGLPGLEAVLGFILVSYIVKFITSYWLFHKKIYTKHDVDHPDIEKRARDIIQSRQIIIAVCSVLAITLFNNIDIIFAKKTFTDFDAGIYSSWALFAKIILYVAGPILSVAFIYFTNKEHEKKQQIVMIYALVLFAVGGTVSFFTYTFFGTLLIHLVFGDRFLSILPYMGQASIFGTLYTLLTFMNNYFLAKNHKGSLILFICMPLYVVLLFLFGKDLMNIMNVNLAVAALASILYVGVFFKTYKK